MLWAVNNVTLFYFTALNLNRYRMSAFELRTVLAHRSDPESKLLKKVNKYLPEITTLQFIDMAALIAASAGLLVYLEQSLIGIVYALLLFTIWSMAAKLSVAQAVADHIFALHYEYICRLATYLSPFLKFLRPTPRIAVISSKEELLDAVQTAPSTVLPPVERQRVELLLKADGKTVKDIMTPKKRVVMIEPSTTLGPVVLSDLQKSGHGYFPVATKKGEPEGVLILNDATTAQLTKGRTAVREVMSAHAAGIGDAASLFDLVEAFLREKQYLMLVRNEEGEFNGVVTIADLMKHLVGVVKD